MPEFVLVIDKGKQSFKNIYSVVMKLNWFFARHFFANDLYISQLIQFDRMSSHVTDFNACNKICDWLQCM